MKIETFEDLERLLKLASEHQVERLKVGDIEVTKSLESHLREKFAASPSQAKPGRNERAYDIDFDPELFPFVEGGKN